MDSSAETKSESGCRFGGLLNLAIRVARFAAASIILGILAGLGATVLTLILYAVQYLSLIHI